MKKLVLIGFLHALGVAVYVTIVAFIMQNGEKIFGTMKDIFGPTAFLLLFVISATITSSLVFGRSVLMYLENRKKEAVYLLFSIIGWLFVLILVPLAATALIR